MYCKGIKVVLYQWSPVYKPGGAGVRGNKAVNSAAKEAAEETSNPAEDLLKLLRKLLPVSKAALKQANEEETNLRWKADWTKSPCWEHMSQIDPDQPYKRFRKQRDGLTQNQGSVRARPLLFVCYHLLTLEVLL